MSLSFISGREPPEPGGLKLILPATRLPSTRTSVLPPGC